MANDNKKTKYFYSFEAKDGDKTKTYTILQPNRKLKESADLFYSSTVSKYIKAGILPRAAYETTLKNLGGTVSDSDKETHQANKTRLFEASIELSELNLKKQEDRTSDEHDTAQKLASEISDLQNKVLSFESAQFMIYENTAEAKARNKTITWLLLHLSYEKNGDQYIPLFKSSDLEGKLDEYEDIQEDEFLVSVLGRINYLITLWFLGRIETEEDFAKFDKDSVDEEVVEEKQEFVETSAIQETKGE